MGANYRKVLEEQQPKRARRILAKVTYHRGDYRVLLDPSPMVPYPGIVIQKLYGDGADWEPALGLHTDEAMEILALALAEMARVDPRETTNEELEDKLSTAYDQLHTLSNLSLVKQKQTNEELEDKLNTVRENLGLRGCNKCGHLHMSIHICYVCGHDGSADEEDG